MVTCTLAPSFTLSVALASMTVHWYRLGTVAPLAASTSSPEGTPVTASALPAGAFVGVKSRGIKRRKSTYPRPRVTASGGMRPSSSNACQNGHSPAAVHGPSSRLHRRRGSAWEHSGSFSSSWVNMQGTR